MRQREPIGRQQDDLRQSDSRRLDPPSLADRATPASRTQPQVAAQPFFNGLLLISFVANVYLIFWLRNLHQKYREMVAEIARLGDNQIRNIGLTIMAIGVVVLFLVRG